MLSLSRLAHLVMVSLYLHIALAAKVLPITPHKIEHSVIVRRELAKRGQLDNLGKPTKRRDVRHEDIIERFDPNYAGAAPLAGVERAPIPPRHRQGATSRSHRLRSQAEYLDLDTSSSSAPNASISLSDSATSVPSAPAQVQLIGTPLSSISAPLPSDLGTSLQTSATISINGPVQFVDDSGSASKSHQSTGGGSISGSRNPSSTASNGPAPSGKIIDSVPLDPSSGIAYTIDVGVGNDGVTIPLLIDTGSTIFWVCAKDCTTCGSAGMKLVADVSANTPDGSPPLTYGTGAVEQWKSFTTSLTFGDATLQNYTAVAAMKIDDTMMSFGDIFSGIFGVGITPGTMPDTPIDILYGDGTIASPLIGFYLALQDSDDSSQIVIGDPFNIVDTDLHIDYSKKANLTQADADNTLYNVKMDDFKIHGMTLNRMQNQIVVPDTGQVNLDACADNRSTSIYLPPMFVDGVFNTLTNGTTWTYGGHYVVPCDLYPKELEVLSLVFAGIEFGVQWQTIMGSTLESLGIQGFSGWCYPHIGLSPAADFFILGDAFLVNVFHTVNTQTGEVTFYGYTT